MSEILKWFLVAMLGSLVFGAGCDLELAVLSVPGIVLAIIGFIRFLQEAS